jgi:catechol 2,3-dioxygenase-like lactoylglutathione lyase family enzyme
MTTVSAMTGPGLDVGIVTADHDSMVQWYTKVLGFAVAPTPVTAPMVRVSAGASTIKLLPRSAPKRRGGIDEACGYRLLTVIVDNIEAVSERAQAIGKKPIAAQTLDQLGFPRASDGSQDATRIAFVHDPDGNLLELIDGAGVPGVMAIGLTVTDAEATRRFWVDVVGGTDLGTTPIGPALTKRDVQIGGTIVKFWQHATPPALLTGALDDAAGIRYLTAAVDDVDVRLDQLRAAGADVAMEPLDLGGGVRIAFAADPDANWFELVTRT